MDAKTKAEILKLATSRQDFRAMNASYYAAQAADEQFTRRDLARFSSGQELARQLGLEPFEGVVTPPRPKIGRHPKTGY